MKSLKSAVTLLAFVAGLLTVPVLLAHAQTAASAPAVAKEAVNINTATAEQLELLKGIGPKLAKEIVDHRAKMGGSFKSVDDLKMVKGVSDKLLAKIKDSIVLEGETTMKPAEKAAPKKKTSVKKEAAPKAEPAPAPEAPAPAPNK